MRLSAAVVLLLPVLAAGQPAITFEKDVGFGRAGDRELKLDLARPAAGAGPFPCVVCLHGGGWRMGNKRDMRPWLDALAREGFVAASVGYRLAPEFTFPSQIEDVKTAVRFLRAHSREYKIDGQRFGVLGYSAGGHLACLLGLTDEKAGFEGKEYPSESSRVQAVVDYFGPTDLSGFAADESAQRGMLGPFIGKKYADDPAAHDRASPVRYVSRAAPPFLIFHGQRDRVVPIEQSRHLAGKLKEAGGPVRLIEVPGEGHGWSGPASVNSTEETIRFLNKHLKK